ncbi:TauD/TfdA family dioxygenase [Streptomyces sp. NPDC056323]|uniref:TauD/TfdA family dioxygenase n=1 Tax=unclassified Streptomyces TaxID=2593676 RepID=UPI0035E3862B
MPVEVRPKIGDDAQISLDGRERAELTALAVELRDAAPRLIDDPRWMAQARELSCLLPPRLRQVLRQFTWNSGREAMLLVRNLPVDPETVPDTPAVRGSVQRESSTSAASLVLVAMAMGEVIAFDKEKSGALVQDVVPVPGMEEFQGNAGSTKLNMHTENAFHEHKPDLVGLMCLRNDHENIAGLRVASVRNAVPLLSDRTRAVLHQPRFVTVAPASFELEDGMQEPHGILSGSVDDPDLKVDFSSTLPVDDEAGEAMAQLESVIEQVAHTLILRPGDLAFVDNRLALHGRNAFQPRYDGQDRWLQRVFVHLDFRKSRALRRQDGQVLGAA